MKKINSEFSFGLTSRIITKIGLLTGLSNINNKRIITTGILTIVMVVIITKLISIYI